MSLIKLVLWERYLAHKDVRTVFDKASAAQAAADGTAPFADPDVERAMTKALERYEEREARKKLKAMDLEHRIPRKTKLVPKKPKRQPRMGPVLISAKYVVEQAAARGFKDLRPVEEAVLGQVEAGAEAEGAAAAPDSTTVSPAGENTKEAAPSRQ